MHYHIINNGMDTDAERNIVDDDRKRAEWLFESYMYAAAASQARVRAKDRWDWEVENPVSKEWFRVAVDECNEEH